ncbi:MULTISPECIES: DEAD/DEAH box helicase [unclassified Agarivorans]|uniref:DEAD/DEAH box helicase n=1 Tax=unclassified Agarivorans TaxID=2636026 RepID=UPI0026E474E3|nr:MULTISPECIES: DEAD/DEAH box helicase [unclassified Agarivorans]MDO6684204.1 DEAD/DEAH box helicase [Agarivorans sp. 3_MG-2023]MDO6714062.1 DEAD/DEAH box helicase [Agarivorans sp. 2_MG-2023]
MLQLRDYQQASVDSVLAHFRQSDDAAVVVLPTGAGKSIVIAELARLAKHPILVLAHVKELVEQNQSKFTTYGFESGVFAAGLGLKQNQYSVTFASVQSLSRNLDQFLGYYSLVVIDECHRVNDDSDSQYQVIINHLKQQNPQLKVLGLTATPYRLDKGWIYQQHYHGYARGNENAWFKKCIYELPLRHLISKGYLTQPLLVDAPAARYQFDELPTQYSEAQLDQFLAGCPRVTQAICKQLVQLAEDRKGVMVFAATVKHAQEIAHYLPEDQTAVVTAETPNQQRDSLIEQFKRQQLKFLVNVSVLTTGFDAPHVDLIAILRRTASVSLYQQIAGRGLRLYEGKSDCLIVDYAGNNYDLYQPEIGETKPNPNSTLVQVSCPQCEFANMFWGITDKDGDILEHYGRRCQGLVEDPSDQTKQVQCSYRYKYKQCSQCNAENDIAARQCHSCGFQLIDPDNQLKDALQLKDRKVLRCSGMSASCEGDKLKLIYHDEDGAELSEHFNFAYSKAKQQFNALFSRRVEGESKTITSAEQAEQLLQKIVAPDFVIAKKLKHYWQVEHRIFDYQGHYRKANQQY